MAALHPGPHIQPRIAKRKLPKPIFLIGLPSSVPPEDLRLAQSGLQKKLEHDYHVIVLPNKVDSYTAKVYSVDPTSITDIKDIEKHIKSILK